MNRLKFGGVLRCFSFSALPGLAMSAAACSQGSRSAPVTGDVSMKRLFKGQPVWLRGAISPMALVLALLTLAPLAHAQLTGTRNVPGDYATLEAAITDLNTVGVGVGGVVINLVAGNPQTAPAGGYAINLATSNATTTNNIVLRGNGNTITAPTTHVVGALTDAIFKIVGEDFVTIDGFVMNENAANTTTVAASNNMTEFGVALFYRTTTDGAQNASILGNTITLNRTYQNTFGIYSNSTHSATVVGTTANATGTAGANSGLVIRGNTISNVNNGVTVVGSAASAADQNEGLDIGGTAVATGNTITNYGTTGTFSSYVNVSGTVNGILVRNTRNFNVSFNTITSSNGGTTAGTLRGIFVPAFTVAPAGVLVNTINNNRISVRTAVVTGALQGIIVDSGTQNPTASLTINNNTFIDSGYAVGSASGASTFVSVAGSATAGPLNTTINGNTFDNLSIASSGSSTLITNNFTRPINGTVTVNNNSIATGFTKTIAGGTVTGYINNSSSPSSVTEINTGNNFSNITLAGTGSTTFVGWQSSDGTTPGSRKTVTNNTINNVSNATTGANTGMNVGFSDNTFAGNEVSGNVISNIASASSTATTAVIGISSTSGNQIFTNNTIHTLNAAGTGAVTGISISGGTTQNVSRNRIYNLSHSNAAGLVNGVVVSLGTTVNVFNNLIGDLRAPVANSANPIVGINITGGTAVNADYNSVFLNATSSGALFGSSALSASTSVNLTLRNNNLVNLSTPAGIGVTAAYRRSTTTLTTYQAASNANNLSAPTLYFDGTNSDLTIVDVRNRLSPRDANSVSENVAFASTTGSDVNFLNVNPVTPTQLESGGIAVAGITTDFGGATRNATAPDIGAWEFAGTLLDLNPPSITYVALATTTSTANRTLAATINDASGVAGGANAPRVYFRKNAGSYFSTACTGSSPSFVCTIDNALMGGVTGGDTINYFVIAQDVTGNVGANPGAGLVATNVNTVTTPPTTPASYLLVSAFPAAVNVGSGETFTSLTNPGGLFAALNAGVLAGNVAVTLTTDLAGETGAVALNQLVEEGAGNYTLTIRPSGARIVSGEPATGGRLIDFNGTDRVTIDGLNAAGNSLLIRNGGVGEIIRFINDASSNTLTNLVLEGGAGVTAVNVATGVVTGNDGIVITRNTVRDRTTPTAGLPFNSIGSTATSLTVQNSNLRIEDNTVINFGQAGVFIGVGSENVRVAGNQISQTAPRTTTLIGIAINGMSGNNEVVGNTIRDLETNVVTTGQLAGISVGTSVGTNLVSGNVIRDLRYTATTGTFLPTRGMLIGDMRTGTITRNRIFGLQTTSASTAPVIGVEFAGSSGNPSNVSFFNNYISLAPSAVGAFQVIGIFDFAFANNTFGADYNSVYVGGTASGTVASWAYRRGNLTPTLSTVRNNILYNARTGGTGNHYAIGDQSLNTGTWTSNRNLFVGTGATAGNHFDLGTVSAGTPVSFTAWQAGLPTRDANSTSFESGALTLSNYFVDALAGNLDLLATAVGAVNAGAPIVGITTDIVGTLRQDPPEIGAFELVPANTPPTITATASLSRQQGSGGSNSTIATVGDAESGAGAVVVTGASTVNGITLSNIVNTAGTISGDLVASCTATNAAFTLTATDPGAATATATLNVSAAANTAPVQGTYGNATLIAGAGTTLNPSAAPTDNGTIASITATAPGFSGTATVSTKSGVVTISNAGPASVTPYVFTVTATDNCGATSTSSFSLTVNAPNAAPTISAASGLSRQQGSPVSNSVIANVTDDAGNGTVVVTGASTVNGITLSNIVNTAGSVTGDLIASCGATNASFTLTATDTGSLTATSTLNVAAAANAPPVLGSYAASSVVAGNGTTVTPSAAPTDNGSVTALTASAPAFIGTLSGNPASGVITVGNAGPAGTYTVTVTATDNCGATSTTTFQLTVNASNADPTIAAQAGVTRQQGSAATVGHIASVTDDGGNGTVVVTVNGGASATVNGVTLSAINNVAGTVNASIVASCTATNASFTLTATDTASATATATLNVAASANTAPVLGSYANTSVGVGTGTTITPSAAPTDNGTIASLTAAAPGFTGTVSVNPMTGAVTLSNAGAASLTPYTVTLTATDNCGAVSTATFQVTVTGADLSITKTSSLNLVNVGLIQYSIVVSNAGPNAAPAATVVDNFPAGLANIAWTCVGIGGGSCTANGTGNINRQVNLPSGATVVFSVTAQITPAVVGDSISNTATVSATVADGNPANNSATVINGIWLFKDGFELPPAIAAQTVLQLADVGIAQRVALPTQALSGLALSVDPIEAIRFAIGADQVVVQARQLGAFTQLRTVLLTARGSWSVSEWRDLGASGVDFEWTLQAAGLEVALRGR